MRWQNLKNNSLARARLELRGRILKLIREFFWQEGFLEIDSPLLVSRPSLEAYLESFETELINEKGRCFPAYLITSPEYTLKKILMAGFHKIFQLSHVFRNGEPWGGAHNPEFTLLEWYRTRADYREIMDETERMIIYLLKQIRREDDCQKLKIKNPTKGEARYWRQNSELQFKIQNLKINYQDHEIDLSLPWRRLSMKEAWQRYAGVDLNKCLAVSKMRELARKKGYQVSREDSFDDLFFKIFLSEIEPKIVAENRPFFLYDYPAQMAALARRKKSDPRYAERVELYLGGLELMNGYSELVDWQEQAARFRQEQARRRQSGKKPYNIDTDFLAALKFGLPACAGTALGVDRLIMLLADARSIDEVMPFSARELFENY